MSEQPSRDALGRFVSTGTNRPPRVPAPAQELRPGISWDGRQGELAVQVPTVPGVWDDILREWDLDPAEVEVVEPIRRISWDSPTKDGGVQKLHYVRASIRRRRAGGADIDQLMEEVRGHRPTTPPPPSGVLAYVQCSGDLQAGKTGTAGMTRRFLAFTDAGVARLKELRALGRSLGPVYLPWLGDCIEHVSGHYEMQRFTVELSLTEQIRLVRRLMLHQIKLFAPLTSELIVPAVPGNHDESVRSNGKAITNFSDSWATEIASQCADILAENPDAYGHVRFVTPRPERLDLTLDVCGTRVGFAHGHQFRGRTPHQWWAGQAHGQQDIGSSTLLLAGHLHHFVASTPGRKTFIQIPALDSGSPWWEQQTGSASTPGVVSLVVGEAAGRKGWRDLEILEESP